MTERVRQVSNVPTRKVMMGSISGALVALIMYGLRHYGLLPADDLFPTEAVVVLVTAAVGYFFPPANIDQVTTD